MMQPMTRSTTVLMLAALLASCAGGSDEDGAEPGAADTAARSGAAAAEPGADGRPASDDPAVAAWLARVDSALFTSWGACPFECCVYRDWVAEARVVVRAEPSTSSAVVATLEEGERFQADTGFVRVTSPQLVIVTAPIEAYFEPVGPGGGRTDTLAIGDTLLVMHPVGEGHWLLTDGRRRFTTEQFWPSGDYTPYSGVRGRPLGEHAAEWWARVRTGEGVEGWIDAYASELGNVDACG